MIVKVSYTDKSVMKTNELVNVLYNLASNSEVQLNYIHKLGSGNLINLDELILEFDDSKYLWSNYSEEIIESLKKIEKLFGKIDQKKLHDFKDLNHRYWNEIRNESCFTLSEMNMPLSSC